MESKILLSSTLRQCSICGHFLPPVSNTSKLVMRLMLASAFRVKNRLLPSRMLGETSLHEMPAPQQAGACCRLPGSRPAQPNQTGAQGEAGSSSLLSPRLFVWLLHMPADLVCGGTSQRSWGSEKHRMACVEGMLEIVNPLPRTERPSTVFAVIIVTQ